MFLICFTTLSFAQFSPDYSVSVKNIDGIEKKFPWVGGFNNAQFSEVDLNGDGLQDLFVFDRAGNKIYTFLNNGTTGTFDYTYAPQFEARFPALHDWALLVDYNCDGAADIFSYTNYPAAGIRVFDGFYDNNNMISYVIKDSLLVYPFQSNEINLYVSSVDIPAITDVNGDGDVDVLTFQITGGYVMYFENTSKETGNGCSALTFKLEDNCWGDFYEGSFKREDSLNVPCPFLKMPPATPEGDVRGDGERHTGSTLLSFDDDGDGLRELITGDISWSNLVYLHNSGDPSNAHIEWQDTLFPSYDTSADVFIFPAAFRADVNNDGLKDILVAPNSQNGAENYNCAWYYKNTGTATAGNYEFQTRTLFIDDMTDVGEGAYPAFFDVDNDGLKDILIGNYGYFDKNNPNIYSSQLAYYRNTGDAAHPSFQLMDNDFAGIAALSVKGVCPTFADLDGDGDMDMLSGRDDGTLLFFRNTAPAGSAPNFVFISPNYGAIDVGNFSTPQLVDADKDGLVDLLIGERDGNIDYYRNTGTSTAPVFTFQTNDFGGVSVNQPGYLTGYSVPFLSEIEPGQGYTLLVGSELGYVFRYTNVDGNLTGTFNKADSIYSGIQEGLRSSVSGADVDGDGKIELVVGNYRGGVTYFNESPAIAVNAPASNPYIKIYPNPASGQLQFEFPQMLKNSTLELNIVNYLGEEVSHRELFSAAGPLTIDVSSLPVGVYFVRLSNENYDFVSKVVVSR